MNKLFNVTFIIGTIGVFGFLYVFIDSDIQLDETIKTSQKEIEDYTKIKEQRKPIEILYLDNEKIEKKIINDSIEGIEKNLYDKGYEQQTYQKKENKIIDKLKNQLESKNIITHENIKEITNYKNIYQDNETNKGKYSIYASVTIEEAKKKRNKMIPPSTPIIIKARTSNNNEITVAIDSDVYNYASKSSQVIIITDNNPDDTIDGFAILEPSELSNENQNTLQENTGEILELVTPPQVGQ